MEISDTPIQEDPIRKSRFTEIQIVAILKESEAGTPTNDLVCLHGISAVTFYNWRKKYGGMEASEARRLKQLEDEDSRLKRIVANQELDITMLKDVLGKSGEPREPQGRCRPPFEISEGQREAGL